MLKYEDLVALLIAQGIKSRHSLEYSLELDAATAIEDLLSKNKALYASLIKCWQGRLGEILDDLESMKFRIEDLDEDLVRRLIKVFCANEK